MKLSLEEVTEHYESSRANYNIPSAETHLAYYRDKYPVNYKILLNSLNP